MSDSSAPALKRLHLIEELNNAAATIEVGLAVLQRSADYTQSIFVLCLLLSVGLERFMKVLLSLHVLSKTKQFPTDKDFKRWGHDLVLLRNEVVDICFDETALARPAMVADRDFMRSDPLLKEILIALTDFAKTDRYMHLSALNEPAHHQEWLADRWDKIERRTTRRGVPEQAVREGQVDGYLRQARNDIIICLERFLRALARTVTLSGLDADARSLGTRVWPFLMRSDEQLGGTTYEFTR